jgi:hypothetical protein
MDELGVDTWLRLVDEWYVMKCGCQVGWINNVPLRKVSQVWGQEDR